ncbi:MAG: T9SS type A sorting domain-containing protein, partial [Bacteroidales bacterium]|nr:T9SS type A sorting domain-containing protein [Bacteroidales bacterium]
PPQNLSACSGIDKITISWDKDNESTSYKLFKNNELLDEIADNFFEDYDVETGKNYEYYVIAVNNDTGEETAPSNKDVVTFVAPLQIPYSSNFSIDKYGFEQSDWVIKNVNGIKSLCNNNGNGHFSDNYLSFAELDWFPIRSDIENISVRFKWRGTIIGAWYYMGNNNNNAGIYFEVTTDRKTWHKLAYFSGDNIHWKDNEFSLNDYIGSDFFQARFRLESSGSDYHSYIKTATITDIQIDTVSGVSVKEILPYISSFNFSPNPASNYINIATNQQEPYQISIYDMNGSLIFAQDNFNDGTLNVAQLKKGIYMIVASTKQHRVARKLVKQ